MKYKNTKTGAIIDSPCTISGGDWVVFEPGAEAKAEPDTEPAGVKSPAPDPDIEPEPEPIPPDGDLTKYSVADLKEIAFEFEIELTGAKNKTEIIDKIEKSGKF